MSPPIKWQGITAQATRPILQSTIMLTTVAISMEEIHWTITDIRSDIMVLTMEVSLMTLEYPTPTVMMKNPKKGFETPAKAAAMEPVATFASSPFFKPNQILKNCLEVKTVDR
ncbi:hypothetical protein QQP08_008024 [Theobroma cacao]|nr:hypothetical protein QQP08_008024 [Theobroma cacao]